MRRGIAIAAAGALLAAGAAGLRVKLPGRAGAGPEPPPAPEVGAPPEEAAAGGAGASSPGEPGELRDAWGQDRERVERERLLARAAALGTPASVAWLAETAARDRELGALAGAALARVANPAAAPALAAVAVGADPVIARANAARALGAAGGAPEVPLLARLVADEAQPLRVRQESALALAKLKAAPAAPTVARLLDETASDPSPDAEQLRISLVQALASARTAGARAALARHAERPLGPTERAFVVQALGAR